MCTARGSDVRPGVPLASLQLRRFRVAGMGQCALPGGLWRPLGSAAFAWQAWDNLHCQGVGCTPMASLWRPLGSAAFAWQPCDNVHCQVVGCTPWRPSGVPWAPPLLRGRRVTISIAQGSDVRPGVPLASLGLRRFCVAGV